MLTQRRFCLGVFVTGRTSEIICAPPAIHVGLVCGLLEAPYQVAVQNCWTGPGGAYTGETSAEMIADAGIPWVILGHSERRALCGETSDVSAIGAIRQAVLSFNPGESTLRFTVGSRNRGDSLPI
eukprot:1185285-Prorocentrum_minimum.AAC.3